MSSSNHLGIIRISVISKKKQLKKFLKGKEKYSGSFDFRFTGKPFGIREVIRVNTGTDVRTLPFFPVEEDYHPVYPDRNRKQMMLEQMTAIKNHFDNAERITVWFSALAYKQYFARADKPLLISDFSGYSVAADNSITVTVPVNHSIPEIQSFKDINCHDNFVRVVNEFYQLVELICQQDNGYYLSDV